MKDEMNIECPACMLIIQDDYIIESGMSGVVGEMVKALKGIRELIIADKCELISGQAIADILAKLEKEESLAENDNCLTLATEEELAEEKKPEQ